MSKEFSAEVKKLLSEGWTPAEGATSKWCVLRDCVLKAAKSVLGREDSKQPDWFVESYLRLHSLIIKRNHLFQRWLRTQLPQDREHFVSQCRHVARMVREAKYDWYQQQAQLVEKDVTGGGSMHVVWQSLHNIRQSQAGLQPVRPKLVC